MCISHHTKPHYDKSIHDITKGERLEYIIISYIIDIVLFIYTIGFSFFRIGELIPLVAAFPWQCSCAFLGLCNLHTSSSLGLGSKRLVHVVTILLLIYTMDSYVPKPLPSAAAIKSTRNPKTIVITGANSGIGFETARQLAVTYGMNIIMGCRSQAKCDKASNTINDEVAASSSPSGGAATPFIIDLDNFDSVASFASRLEENQIHVDILFNNAGYVPKPNQPVNDNGFNPAFSSMHLSHFLLTELLIKSNPSLRVINTSSITHHLCTFPFAFFSKSIIHALGIGMPLNPGCVDKEFLQHGLYSVAGPKDYAISKMANAMHTSEIPRVHEQSTAIAIDLGWVGTSIIPIMTGTMTPASVGWMRSAPIGVLPIMHAILSSKDELMKELGSKADKKDGGFVMNTFGRPEEAFKYPWDLGSNQMESLERSLWINSVEVLTGLHFL